MIVLVAARRRLHRASVKSCSALRFSTGTRRHLAVPPSRCPRSILDVGSKASTVTTTRPMSPSAAFKLWPHRVSWRCFVLRHKSINLQVPTYIISSLFKLTTILVPLMLSHLLIHLPPLHWRSLFSVCLASSLEQTSIFTSWTSFTSLCLPQYILLFFTFSIHQPFTLTLNSKLTFLVNLFHHRSLTIDTSDWLPRLMGPFSVFTVFVGFSSCFWCVRQNYI